MSIDRKIIDEACTWHAAMAGDDPDFDGFTAWLEASPDHARAFDEVMLLDDRIDANCAGISAALPANDLGNPDSDDAHGPRSGFRWLAAAAALALAVPGALWWSSANAPVELRAGGAPVEVALDGRTRVTLDRNSLIHHGKGRTDQVELASGAASFDVTHDPAQRFMVKAGDVEIVDIGTRFEVQRNGAQVSVAVAQGEVSIAAAGHAPQRLQAGQRALVEKGVVTLSKFDPLSLSSWRTGQLVYSDAPLAQVAREISRYTPAPVSVDPSLADRRFSGVLTIGDGRALDRNLADFAGLVRVAEGDTIWIRARN